ncbi:MAG: hypothetical protein RL622_931, partial [Actinomycetota bacterium]
MSGFGPLFNDQHALRAFWNNFRSVGILSPQTAGNLRNLRFLTRGPVSGLPTIARRLLPKTRPLR